MYREQTYILNMSSNKIINVIKQTERKPKLIPNGHKIIERKYQLIIYQFSLSEKFVVKP